MLEDNITLLKGIILISEEIRVKGALLGLIEIMENEDLEGLEAWDILDAVTQILLTGHYHLAPSNEDEAGDTLTAEHDPLATLSPEDIEKLDELRKWFNEKED